MIFIALLVVLNQRSSRVEPLFCKLISSKMLSFSSKPGCYSGMWAHPFPLRKEVGLDDLWRSLPTPRHFDFYDDFHPFLPSAPGHCQIGTAALEFEGATKTIGLLRQR